MFKGCTNFNQPLDNWNVENVYDMNSMFQGCTNFNQPLNNWNLGNVVVDDMFDDGFNREFMPDRVRNPVPVLAPVGIAFEVHNAFANFETIKKAYLDIINQGDKQFSNPIDDLDNKFKIYINADNFTDTSNKLSQLNTVYNKIKYVELVQEQKNLIGRTIDFVFSQESKEFKDAYITSFLEDCLKAYTGGEDNSSCTKGIIERVVLSVGTACEILCINNDASCTPTYRRLYELFTNRVAFNLNDEASKWFETAKSNPEIIDMNPGARKDRFISDIKERALQLQAYTIRPEEEVNREIEDYANNAINDMFDDDEFNDVPPIAIGGKTSKRKTSKRKTSKRKTSKRKTSKRKTSKRKITKRKTTKRKTTKRKTTKR
jgi:surface protein